METCMGLNSFLLSSLECNCTVVSPLGAPSTQLLFTSIFGAKVRKGVRLVNEVS